MRDRQAGLPAAHDGPWVSRNRGAMGPGIEIDDFDQARSSEQGGLGRMHQLLGAELPKVIEELNRGLVA